MGQFEWVDFYKEFAKTLLGYKNKRDEIIEKIIAVYKNAEINLPTLEKDNNLVDIDPFTIFGLFNKSSLKDSNRIKIINGLADAFGVDMAAPTTFGSIPTLNNQNATFYYFIGDREDDDINNLWELFDAALKYAAEPSAENREFLTKYFDIVINKKGNGNSKITMGLYWIAPDVFLNLDSRNEWYIYSSGKIPADIVDTLPKVEAKIPAKKYFDIVEALTQYLKSGKSAHKDFTELSLEAWKYSTEVNEENKQAAKSQREDKNDALADKDVQTMDNIFMHDAVPTWSGFLYQGRIAVYLAVKKIIELKETGKESEIEKYELELEKCEDIALIYFDGNSKKYSSIHQVKNEKGNRISSYKDPLIQLMLERGFCRKNNYGNPSSYLHISKKLNTENRNLDEYVSEYTKQWKNDISDFYNKLKGIYDNFDVNEECLTNLINVIKNNIKTIGINREEYKKKCESLKKVSQEELDAISKGNILSVYDIKDLLGELINYLDEKLYVKEVTDEVQIYEYELGESFCSAPCVFEAIVNLIKKYKGTSCQYSIEQYNYLADLMINFIEERILERHRCMQENKSPLYRIALSKFQKILDETIENDEQEANVLALRRIYNEHLESYCNMCHRNNEDNCQSSVCKLQQPEYRKEMLEKEEFVKYCYNLNPECDKQIYDRTCLGYLINRDGMMESVFPIIKNVASKYLIVDEDKIHIKLNNQNKVAYTTAISNYCESQVVENIEKSMKDNQGLIETIFDADQLITTRLNADSSVWESSCIKVKPDDIDDVEINKINNQNSIYVPKKPEFVKAEEVIKKMENEE